MCRSVRRTPPFFSIRPTFRSGRELPGSVAPVIHWGKALALGAAIVLGLAFGLPAAASASGGVSVSPDLIEFKVPVGSSGGPDVATIRNETSEAIGVSVTAPGPFNFEFIGACGSSEVQPHSVCEVLISFSPLSESLEIAELKTFAGGFPTGDDVFVVGQGLAPPTAEISPGSWDFGTVAANQGTASHTFVVKNTGSSPVQLGTVGFGGKDPRDFQTWADACAGETLEPSKSCDIEVGFEPGTPGEKEASLEIGSNAEGGTIKAELSGLAEPNAKIAVTPTEADFGRHPVGPLGGTKTFVVESVGSTPVTIEKLELENLGEENFRIESDGCSGKTLDPHEFEAGESCEFEVGFEPRETGLDSGKVWIKSDAVEGPVAVKLSGEGFVEPDVSVEPTESDFAATVVGSPVVTKGFLVKSTGLTPLHVSGATVGGADAGSFVVETDGCLGATLQPGEECGVIVAFGPQAMGALQATLEVSSDAVGGVSEAELTGEGQAPVASIAPTSHDFGDAFVGEESGTEELAIENTGTAPLEVQGATVGGSGAGQFKLDASACEGVELAPHETCTVESTFAPNAAGPASATIEVESDSFEPDPTAALEGEGIVAVKELTIEPAEWNYGSVKVGAAAPEHTFVVENTGNAPIVPAAVELSGAGASAFEVGAGNCVGKPLAPAETCEVTAGFSPTSKGAESATLTIGSEEGGVRPAAATLAGTGVEEAPTGAGDPPVCTPVEVTGLAPYLPTTKGKSNALGLRARFSTDASTATVNVTASITFKTKGGKARTASLGSGTLNVYGGFANYKVPIPAKLKKDLPLGAKVTLKLAYSSKTPSTACSTFGPTQRKTLRTKVTWVSL